MKKIKKMSSICLSAEFAPLSAEFAHREVKAKVMVAPVLLSMKPRHANVCFKHVG